MSFDVIRDSLGDNRSNLYPLTSYLVCGTSMSSSFHNSLLVVKLRNILPLEARMGELRLGLEEEEELEEEEDSSQRPRPEITSVKIDHRSCVNRIRVANLQGRQIAATWSEQGQVHLWNLQHHLAAVDDGPKADYNTKPLFSFSGHGKEGYALSWSSLVPGRLASGGCDSRIFVWSITEEGWKVYDTPLSGHRSSVEDIQWSPNEQNVIASCSSDHTVKVWDVRNLSKPSALDIVAHDADVNSISWNKNQTHHLLSGGDDGVVKIWDFRYIKVGSPLLVTYLTC
ncbi:GRWD1 [Cordylochernes scorpioides]|uniref:Glutamate-rich WD repeat-containing protein 1 n=1 Tax=Cordylochernes scorpioides TaxID=51811 RepID=A0ABY6KFZ9_9ARAC|nr:GRWD1 [Cordylochernes scorpioides]